ncbi:MAG: hypothetical protein RLZZ303_2498 [Candidatus Hydrogenedentota bacterium]
MANCPSGRENDMAIGTAKSEAEVVYVLGSGASLLRLGPEECARVERGPAVAMNKYLLFWELAGIWPSHYFLADIHYPALRVYEESVAIARTRKPAPHFLLDESYRLRYGGGFAKRMRNLPFQLRQRWRHGYTYQPSSLPAGATYFKRCHRWAAPQIWGETLDDLMYFHRGSLSVLINLLTVLRLGRHIKLLGVDLGTPGSFYDEAIQSRPYLFDDYMRLQQSGAVKEHVTAATFQGMPGIQAKWPFIQENVERRGFRLSCCNPDSLLVREGLCPYAPVLDVS